MSMRRLALLPALALTALLHTAAHAQTMADVLRGSTPLTFIGLDFSAAKLVPPVEFEDVDADARMALIKWNNLLEQEPGKYSMGKALDLAHVPTNTSLVRPVNDKLTATELLGREHYELDAAKIPAMVKAYGTSGEGVGVVLIVSTFDKNEVSAVFHIVFFRMGTKEVVHSQRLTTKPMGFGLRNYWAGAVARALDQVHERFLPEWRQQFR